MKKIALSRKNTLGIFAFSAAFLALSAARTAVLLTSEVQNGFYGTPAFRVFEAVCGAVLILLFAVFSRFSDRLKIRSARLDPLVILPSLILGGAVAVLSIRLFAISGDASGLLKGSEILSGVFGIGSVVCLAVYAFSQERRGSGLAYLSLFPAFFFAFLAVVLYFEKLLPLNAPLKIAEQIALIALSIESLLTARIALGREKPRLHFAVSLSAMGLCFYASVPALICSIVGGATVTADPVLTVSLFLCSIFLFCKTIALFETDTDQPAPEVADE